MRPINFFSILIFYSCAVYSPQNTPPVLVKEKGEVQIDGETGIAAGIFFDMVSSVGVAYAISDGIAVQAFASTSSMEMFHYDANIGYLKDIGDKTSLGFFGGYFIGYRNNADNDIVGYGRYQSGYGKIQLLHTTNGSYLGFTNKIAVLFPNYYSLNTNYLRSDISDSYSFEEILQTGLIVEPSFFYSYRISQNLSMGFNLSFCYIESLSNKDNQDTYDYLPYNPISFGVNVSYKFGKR